MDHRRRHGLADRYVIHVRSKSHPSDPNPTSKPRYLGSGEGGIKYYWDGSRSNRSTFANHSALYADNDFMKKTRMLTDMLSHPVKYHSFTTVLVIAGIFLFFTITITVAIVVFCRKKNSVFALQKSEQEDDEGDYEMDDLNTDLEYTETDVESEYDNISRRRSYPLDASAGLLQARPVHDPFHGLHRCRCREHGGGRGTYRTMTVAAVLERPAAGSDSDDYETRLINDSSYTQCAGDTDADSDHELAYSARCHLIDHSASCPYGENAYGCAHCQGWNTNNNNNSNSNNNNRSSGGARQLVAACGKHYSENVTLQSSFTEGAYDNVQNVTKTCTEDNQPYCLYVDLPPDGDERLKTKNERSSYYVALPPKGSDDEGMGVEYHNLGLNGGSSIIDLHPEGASRRPDTLRLSPDATYFDVNEIGRWTATSRDGSEFGPSRSSLRSRSVTDKLSTYANTPVGPAGDPRSCPQTPLTETARSGAPANRIGFSLSRGAGSLPHHYSANKQNVNNVMYSDSMLQYETQRDYVSPAHSNGASFILSSPYSSAVSLTKAPVSEIGPHLQIDCYSPDFTAPVSLGHLANFCLLQDINNDSHCDTLTPPASADVGEEHDGIREDSAARASSSNQDHANTTRESYDDAIGQEDTGDGDDGCESDSS